jgi:putative FmdB family regulatory protein
MPLYEYQCESCGHQFEQIQKFSDPLVDTCPRCGGGPVRKLLSSPAIQFKGSGWYITDYARKGGTDSGKSEKKADTAAETKPAGDAKPAAASGGSEAGSTKSD